MVTPYGFIERLRFVSQLLSVAGHHLVISYLHRYVDLWSKCRISNIEYLGLIIVCHFELERKITHEVTKKISRGIGAPSKLRNFVIAGNTIP